MVPTSDGFCIDRADMLNNYNTNADDGYSWVGDHRARALVVSWRSLLDELGPLMHDHGQVIFCNIMDPRLDLARNLDGIYDELGELPTVMNGVALLCADKPLIVWTRNTDVLSDEFFQRHLYLGAFPTAPYPLNNHCIQPSPQRDEWYLDYAPLFELLRGKQWVLEPRCIEVKDGTAKANLFKVPGGWVAPVMFGGTNSVAIVKIQNVPGIDQNVHCEAVHPGTSKNTAATASWNAGTLEVSVPLVRGCAMLKILPMRE